MSDTQRNIVAWTRVNAEFAGGDARRAWLQEEITWGSFGTPEREVRALGDVAGFDVVELGCGTAYFSAWLARLGALQVGVDPTPAQLATARSLQSELGLEFPLIEAGAEDVPLPDASFDLALSEYGAPTWCDPERWVPEAARLLRPGGRLVFLHGTPLTTLCYPDEGEITRTLQRPYFGLGRLEWEGAGLGSVEFQLPYGGWIDVLGRSGFAVERLVELQAPDGAVAHPYYGDVTVEWARQWPAEQIWIAQKR